MNQSKLESFIESFINISIGFVISYLAWPLCASMFGVDYDHSQQLNIVMFFTVLSVARSYIVRRWFNARLHLVVVIIARRFLNKSNN